MVEEWKDIEGYEGKYQVSNYGRVKSLNYNHTGKEKVLKSGDNGKGYKLIVLCKDGKTKTYFVHRLVALAFIPNPNNLPQVNHKDENPSNNSVNNLEWCDSRYNCNYGNHNEKLSEGHKKLIYCVELDMVFDSITQASKYVGCNGDNISHCLKGRYKTCGGYHWLYAKDVV